MKCLMLNVETKHTPLSVHVTFSLGGGLMVWIAPASESSRMLGLGTDTHHFD